MFWITAAVVTGLFGIALYVYIPKEFEKKACLNPEKIEPGSLDVKPDSNEIKILILGDTGSGNKYQKKVAESSKNTCDEKGCDLVLMVGDNFIMHGVKDTEDKQFQSKFEDIYSLDLPFYSILGNHDLCGNWRAQVEYTKKSDRWMMPGVNYSLNAGPVFIQGMNTSCTFCSLWSLFKKSSKPWRLIFGHRPFVSSGRHRFMSELERFFVKLSKPDFILAGHNHILEHVQYRGMDHFVSGGGGSPIHPIEEKEFEGRKYFLQDYGYIWAHLTEEQARFIIYDIDGNELYSYIKDK